MTAAGGQPLAAWPGTVPPSRISRRSPTASSSSGEATWRLSASVCEAPGDAVDPVRDEFEVRLVLAARARRRHRCSASAAALSSSTSRSAARFAASTDTARRSRSCARLTVSRSSRVRAWPQCSERWSSRSTRSTTGRPIGSAPAFAPRPPPVRSRKGSRSRTGGRSAFNGTSSFSRTKPAPRAFAALVGEAQRRS